MRDSQAALVGEIKAKLNALASSPYIEHHLALTSGCGPQCSLHGMCFQGKCSCEEGWKGLNCSVSTRQALCPFDKPSPPCTATECAPFVSTGRMNTLPSSSACAGVVCDFCRQQPLAKGCQSPPNGLFCAERDKRMGCADVQCPVPDSRACGPKRNVRSSLLGCCFNPTLDCEDRCFKVNCPSTTPECTGAGMAVRYPLRDCCFNPRVDCVDACATEQCPSQPPTCPAGSKVRTPFVGCCFNREVDCDDECASTVCEEILPVESCKASGKRWTGTINGCCFDGQKDCREGDDASQTADRAALISLFDATHGSSWRRNAAWRSSSWVCFWEGVECSGLQDQMRVTSLSLAANNMKGTLPPGLFQLEELQVLDMGDNFLTGPLPSEYSRFSKLQALKLNKNALTGPVPKWVYQAPELVLVNIGSNYFTEWETRLDDLNEQTAGRSFTCASNCFCSGHCAPRNTAKRAEQTCSPCDP